MELKERGGQPTHLPLEPRNQTPLSSPPGAPSVPLSVLSLSSPGVEVEKWDFEFLYWDWSGKEALPSLCPPGFWIRFDFVHLEPHLIEIRFSFVNSWARVDDLVLDDFMTLLSDSNTSSLVLQPLESRVHLNRSSWRSRENPRSCSLFFDSS